MESKLLFQQQDGLLSRRTTSVRYLGHDQVAINIASVGETIDEKVCQQPTGCAVTLKVRERERGGTQTSLRSPGRFSSRYRRRRGGRGGDRQFTVILFIIPKQSLPSFIERPFISIRPLRHGFFLAFSGNCLLIVKIILSNEGCFGLFFRANSSLA